MNDSQTTTALTRNSQVMGLIAWTLVLAALIAFFAHMARLEPLTGDGWYNADDVRDGVTVDSVVDMLRHLHHHGNPRIGQLFTILTYGYEWFHRIITPLVLVSLLVLVFVHARGRLPDLRSGADAVLLLAGAAACFLAVPQPGHAWFYRPITTNYLYTLTLTLLFFVPHRLGLRSSSAGGSVAAAVLVLPFALFVGKTNEHT